MIPVAGAIALGIGNLLGSVFGGISQAQSQESANNANISIANRNRDFQEYMSNTAFQRGVADMRRAGLNPVLAAGQGGASTPSGSGATVQAANPLSGLADGISGGVSTALSVAEKVQGIDNAQKDASLTEAQTVSEGVKNKLTANSAAEAAARTEQMRTQLPTVQAKARFDKKQTEIDEKYQDLDNVMRRTKMGVDIGGSALDMVNPLKGLMRGGKSTGPKELMDSLNRAYKRSNIP